MEIKYYQRINKCGRLVECAEYDGIEFIKAPNNYYHHRKYGQLHRYIYEYENNCKIHEGYDIHHKDKNKMNNDINNLIMLTRYEHHKLHWTGENNPNYGKPTWNKGIPCTEEHKRKQSEAMKGRKPGNYIYITDEMIFDYNNGIKMKDFCNKYNVSGRIWTKVKHSVS